MSSDLSRLPSTRARRAGFSPRRNEAAKALTPAQRRRVAEIHAEIAALRVRPARNIRAGKGDQ